MEETYTRVLFTLGRRCADFKVNLAGLAALKQGSENNWATNFKDHHRWYDFYENLASYKEMPLKVGKLTPYVIELKFPPASYREWQWNYFGKRNVKNFNISIVSQPSVHSTSTNFEIEAFRQNQLPARELVLYEWADNQVQLPSIQLDLRIEDSCDITAQLEERYVKIKKLQTRGEEFLEKTAARLYKEYCDKRGGPLLELYQRVQPTPPSTNRKSK